MRGFTLSALFIFMIFHLLRLSLLHKVVDTEHFFPYSVFLTGSSAGASALGSGPRGRRFKSSLPDSIRQKREQSEGCSLCVPGGPAGTLDVDNGHFPVTASDGFSLHHEKSVSDLTEINSCKRGNKTAEPIIRMIGSERLRL